MDNTTKKDGGFTIKVGPYGLYAVLHEHRYVRDDVLETSAEILDDRVYTTEENAQGAILLRIAEAYTGFVDGIEADMGVERVEARRFAANDDPVHVPLVHFSSPFPVSILYL